MQNKIHVQCKLNENDHSNEFSHLDRHMNREFHYMVCEPRIYEQNLYSKLCLNIFGK